MIFAHMVIFWKLLTTMLWNYGEVINYIEWKDNTGYMYIPYKQNKVPIDRLTFNWPTSVVDVDIHSLFHQPTN